MIGRQYKAEVNPKGGDGSNQHIKKEQIPQNEGFASDKPKTNQTAHRIGKEHGVSNQCARRNLTPEEKRYLLGRKYTAEKAVNPGAQQGNDHAKKHRPETGADVSSDGGKPRTRDRIAAQEGVSKNTVEAAEKFADAVDDLDKKGVARW